ncbi:hypothetical protein D9M68_728360 [compost metagenome]
MSIGFAQSCGCRRTGTNPRLARVAGDPLYSTSGTAARTSYSEGMVSGQSTLEAWPGRRRNFYEKHRATSNGFRSFSICGHRHWLKRDQQHHLTAMLRGFYQYSGLHHCTRKLSWVRYQVQRQWAGTLRRRSQRHRLSWSFLSSREWFELPHGRLLHPMI